MNTIIQKISKMFGIFYPDNPIVNQNTIINQNNAVHIFPIYTKLPPDIGVICENIIKFHKYNSIFTLTNPNINTIIFSNNYDQYLDNLPDHICTIKFGFDFDQLVDKLPISMHSIIFGNNFNKPVDNLPINLGIIEFGKKFNQCVDKLPKFVKNIIFGDDFDQLVDNLPPMLLSIKFGKFFNQFVNNLPEMVNIIFFDSSFNYPVNNLPHNLKILKLGEHFNQTLNNLPNSLEIIILRSSINNHYNMLPSSLQKIYSNFSHSNLPNLVTHLLINNASILTDLHQIKYLKLTNHNCSLDYLPDTLNHLEFNNIKIYNNTDNLPKYLNYLLFTDCDHSYKINFNNLPIYLKYLYINNYYDLNIPQITLNLEYFHLGSGFKFPTNKLPNLPTIIVTSTNAVSKYKNKIDNDMMVSDSEYHYTNKEHVYFAKPYMGNNNFIHPQIFNAYLTYLDEIRNTNYLYNDTKLFQPYIALETTTPIIKKI